MPTRRVLLRSAAAFGAAALVAGPLAGTAGAAAKKKPPAPTITSKPPALTNARTATFAFTDAMSGVTFQCALDGTAYGTCASPKTYSSLAAGAHTFRVRARSGSLIGNATSAAWTIDLTAPPAPSLSGVPSGTTQATSATLTFGDTEAGTTFRCAVDGATATACTSPLSLTGLADGGHTVDVVAVDGAGNESAPTSGAWTVDTTPPPAPSVTTGPATITNATTATFAVYEADPDATLTCSLDGGAYEACTTAPSYSSFSEAPHTFDVKASDAAGNTASATQFAWTVDTTAPTPPSILTGPAAVTKVAVGSFTFDAHDATQLRCSVDGGDYADCGSSFSTASLADGAHTLAVLGRDAATNESGATPWAWTVDATPPPAPSVTGPAAVTKATTATFGITDTEALVTFTCALDGATATACADGQSYSSLVPGAHSLVVTATDAAGNTAQTTYGWTIDIIAPLVTVTAPAALNGPVVATFGEAVHGVSAASFVLRVASTVTNLPATVTCADAGNAAVDCASGAVRTAALKPKSALVAGQHYTAVVNPAAAPTVADVAGNAVATKTTAFRAATTVQEVSPSARYTWRAVPTSAALGSTYVTEHFPNAAVAYTFAGTAVTWYTVTGPNQGTADVYVDGVKRATVNNYAATTTYRVPRPIVGLTAATHKLRVVATGKKGSTKGTGTFVSFDAVKVGSTLTANPTLTYSWRSAPVSAASGGFLAVADLANEQATLQFRGTSISWWTSTGPNRGKASLYVDGVLKATYDNWAATTAYNVRRTVTGLSDQVHTVKLVVLGTHRAGATGNLVCLDRWTIG
ncbi:MAG TPA: hypothetical protein VFQ85_15200 [Mycobacteriales bacterium]|jgi:hypothetical protein|nr:hypothetical protein [Mycobacteriales bacterium]